MYEVDFDRSGEIDFDEFVPGDDHFEEGEAGAFSRFGDLKDIERDENVEALQEDGAHVKLEAAKSPKRYPCTAIMCVLTAGLTRRGNTVYKIAKEDLFHLPSVEREATEVAGHGRRQGREMAAQQRNMMQEARYQPANLVPDQLGWLARSALEYVAGEL